MTAQESPTEGASLRRHAADLARAVRIDLGRVAWRALLLGLLACAVLAIPFVLRHQDRVAADLSRAQAEEHRVVDLVAETVSREIASLLGDLRYLSDHNEVRDVLAEDSPAARERLATEYLAFARQKRRYDQMRVIGADGWEKVRVNARHGRPVIVPPEALQNKGGRYYFAEAMRLAPQEILLTSIDLNEEHGAVEWPQKPTVRLATALFGPSGERRGILVLNYAADHLLSRLRGLAESASGELWLLNSDGYWLIGPPQDEWAFMYPERSDRTLAQLDPATWKRLTTEHEGQFATAGGIVTFRKIHPLRGDGVDAPGDAGRYHWIAATHLPRSVLAARNEAASQDVWLGYGLLATLVLLVSPVLSYYSVQRHGLNRIMASILDNVPDLISYVDTDQRLRFSNRAHRSVLGVRSPEIYGRSLREILGDAAYDVLRPRLDEVLGGRPVTFDTRLVYGGQARDLSIAYMPDAGHGGALRGFVAVESDVTALRDAERRERERMLELAHAGRLACVGEMATQIAHEVNQPLTAIVTYCAAVKHGLGAQQADRSRVGEWLDAIGAQAHRVGDTIRRLRDFVRKGGMTLAPMDLGEVVADAVRMIQPGANRQGVLVAVEPSSSLPEVFADRVLLTQAVLNLVRNAVDAAAASPPDRRLVRVVTAAAPAGVEVRVIDSGPGLAAELEDRLFEPFATTKDGGLGLGLPIARSIVEAHGGEIGYSPAEGGDTCFTLTLPARTR